MCFQKDSSGYKCNMVVEIKPTINTKIKGIYDTHMIFSCKNGNKYVFQNYEMFF